MFSMAKDLLKLDYLWSCCHIYPLQIVSAAELAWSPSVHSGQAFAQLVLYPADAFVSNNGGGSPDWTDGDSLGPMAAAFRNADPCEGNIPSTFLMCSSGLITDSGATLCNRILGQQVESFGASVSGSKIVKLAAFDTMCLTLSKQ